MRLRCANCKKSLVGELKTATSRIYGTHGACTLCEECKEYEDKAVEAKHTNDVPELRLLYLGERRKTERA